MSQGIKQDPKYDNYDFPTVSANTQSGHPGHTTPQQDAQVHQLRTILEKEGYTERLDTLTLVGDNVDLQQRHKKVNVENVATVLEGSQVRRRAF